MRGKILFKVGYILVGVSVTRNDELILHHAGVNLRVPGDLAKQAGFNSIELMDGSGDVWGSPSVYHNLHCLVCAIDVREPSCRTPRLTVRSQKSIRQSFFPEMYPDWKINHPDENGALSPHMDHCIEK